MFNNLQDFVTINQLRDFREIDIRPMFGGYGLFIDGTYFGVAAQGKLFLRTSAQTVDKYKQRGMQPFKSSERCQFIHTYQVPPEIVANPSELCAWADEALANVD